MAPTIRALVRRAEGTVRRSLIIRRRLAHLDLLVIPNHPLLAPGNLAIQLLFISVFRGLWWWLVLRWRWVDSRRSRRLGAGEIVVGWIFVMVLRAATHALFAEVRAMVGDVSEMFILE